MKPKLEIIYRRRIIGDIKEKIEISVDTDVASSKTLSETFDDDSINVSLIEIKDDNMLYSVELPIDLRVKPPDWRDLAYDHAKVVNLINTCVTDNCRNFIFEPVNDTTLKGLQNVLSIALADLSFVIDLISVEINTDQEKYDSLEVIIIYEHKNGELKHLNIKILEK